MARWHGTLDHQAERLRQERADKAEHERLRHELEDAGVTVTDALPPGSQFLTALRHEAENLTPESHAGCPGRGAFFRSYDPTTPVHYCADPTAHGHSLRFGEAAAGPAAAGTVDSSASAGSPEHGPSDASRRLVIQGNKAWKAAAEVRKRWLAADLFPRRTAPREVAQFVAQQLLTMPDPLRSGLAGARSRSLFAEITGKTAEGWAEACGTVAAGRLPLLMLAPIATAYEQAMTDGEGKSTWRTDRYSPCPRQDAGVYLAFMASVGYQLSDIEQAVANGAPYMGDMPSSDALTLAASEEPGDRADRQDPVDEHVSVSRDASNGTDDAADSTNTMQSRHSDSAA